MTKYISLACLLLIGCTNPVQRYEIDWATEQCSGRGGIDEANFGSSLQYGSVRCVDGTKWMFDKEDR